MSSDDIVVRKVTLQKKEYEVVPWCDSDDLPLQIIEKIYKSPVLTSGHLFNINLGYGEGIMPCYIEADENGEKKVIPVLDNEEINLFFEKNDISLYLLEQICRDDVRLVSTGCDPTCHVHNLYICGVGA